MVKHNNSVPCNQNRKDFKQYIRTWFNQPARKLRRQQNREKKVEANGGRPRDLLRPVVHCPTQKYNYKVREGRGFTFEELKANGLTVRAARTIGVSVDLRRKNRSEESLRNNANRLASYLKRIIVLPKGSKAKKGIAGIPDSVKPSDIPADTKLASSIAQAMPVTNYRRMLV